MLIEKSFDVFIAYHGTNERGGSMQKAEEIYNLLKDKVVCFFNPITNAGGRFGDTPTIAKHSKLFLLVANDTIKLNQHGEIYTPGLYNEVDAFYGSVFHQLNKKGCARVFAVDGLTASKADRMHVLFDRAEHFEDNGKDNSALEKMQRWVFNSLKVDAPTENVEVVATVAQEVDVYKEAFEISRPFLHKGAKAIKDKSQEEIKASLNQISLLFKDITTFKRHNEAESFENVGDHLIDIFENAGQCSLKNLAKIKGPLGSYKNRLLQYVYLYLAKGPSKKVVPFYIDLAIYERRPELAEDDNLLLEEVKKDFDKIDKICKKADEKTPLILLDSVRNFSSGKNQLYSYVAKRLNEINCKYVVSLDTDYTINPRQLIKVHPLAPTNFQYFIRIRSLRLYQRQQSLDFLQNCIDTFNIQIHNDLTVNEIYNHFIKLDLLSMDAYWTTQLLETWQNYIGDETVDIADLYYALGLKAVGGSDSELDLAAKLAFEFEYGNLDFTNTNFFFDPKWQLMRKHRSALDYLIARHYVNEFSDFKVDGFNQDDKWFKFFDMVLPKNITRFVTKMISKISGYENKMLQLTKEHYSSLPIFGKSEMVFWLGRFKTPSCLEESIPLLKEIVEQEKVAYYTTNFAKPSEKRRSAFLLRGAYVSMIYNEDKECLREYMDSLIADKTANGVNRGFHLEYYGDKPYIPSQDQLDFVDEMTKGEATCRYICLTLSKRMKQRGFNLAAILEMFTLCSLLQARAECHEKNTMNITPFIGKAKEYLQWILTKREVGEYENVKEYFIWMQKELEQMEKGVYVNAKVYTQYSQAKEVKREGWVRRGIVGGENIVEHMYNCWLLGMLHLPQSYEKEKGYDKQAILNMLLIHDLAETETGDIVRDEKMLDHERYNREENSAMNRLLLNSTYPKKPYLEIYLTYWQQWYLQKDINAEIAKDIDEIQAVFQFCNY
ncbi:MAG: HD domain-containing protein, partial [Clostridia bacterium]|nr:HD domain-containing protein [Clostridia bacterium]